MTQMIKARSRYWRSIRLVRLHGPPEGLVVLICALEVRVLVPGLPTKGIEDVEGPPHQRLSFLDPVGVSEQNRQVVQTKRHRWVLAAEGGLVDLQRPPHQRLGFPAPVSFLKHLRQIVQTIRHGGMLLAEGDLVDCQCPPHQRFGFLDPVGVL